MDTCIIRNIKQTVIITPFHCTIKTENIAKAFEILSTFEFCPFIAEENFISRLLLLVLLIRIDIEFAIIDVFELQPVMLFCKAESFVRDDSL